MNAMLRRVGQFHENPEVNAAWQRLLAPVIRWSTPARRRAILAIGAVVVLFKKPIETMAGAKGLPVPEHWAAVAAVPLILLLVSWLCYRAAVHFQRLPEIVRRRPQITLHALFWGVLVAIWTTAPDTAPWRTVLVGLAVTMPFLLWRLGYLLLSGQRGRAKDTRFQDQFMVLFPVWGGSNTPYGKGLDYLSRHEAKTDEELARSHLAGIKLFVLALVWAVAAELMNGAVYGDPKSAVTAALGGFNLGIPKLQTLLSGSASGALALSWASIYAELVMQVLRHAAEGHLIIGVLRIFGFNVFRNTYKPLLAESIVSFWNRYYYYFKELMSELFFLTTYARRFKAWPRVRLFAAVLAAALIGNMYYHVLLREDLLVAGEGGALWDAFASRTFYCLLLALGIFVSMMQEQARAGAGVAPGPLRRVLRIAGVWTFFALICIWNARGGADFWQRTEFFQSLFGL